MVKRQDVKLAVVESDAPDVVRMFNSMGCDIGTWNFNDWRVAIFNGDIILQVGDRFVFERD